MTKPKRPVVSLPGLPQLPPPGPEDKMARAFYGALTLASTNGCTCQPCQVLRIMHKKLMGDLTSGILKDLEEEE